MALLAKVGDNDQVNLGAGVCCSYPPDTIQFASAPPYALNVFIGGINPLLSGPDSLLTPLKGAWVCPTPPPPTGCLDQLRRLNSLINPNVYANGKKITLVGDSTEQDGYTKRLIIGPGITVGNVFIGGK